ncbi:hypothetical protein [Desulfosarcina sp. BuS5]|uniref:hypothetical protein n=1 Tax=Desulfosarcina sp. BuS5 TaxID=933262 RepID=UPI0012FCFA59|nr:hypothetical protein [Desulfosarcina sp. BuS5]
MMKHLFPVKSTRCYFKFFVSLALVQFLFSCAIDPKNVDVQLEQSKPEIKVTSYSDALDALGLMSEIYATGPLKIQSQGIGDETGTSVSTGGEIQRDITEIMKSTLNSVGGNVQFIEYDPAYIQNQMVTGYSSFTDKMIPDVVITGGITEFDRGLETRGHGTDVGAEATFTGLWSWLPSQTVSAEYNKAGKQGKARITLDFNLKNFQTLAGIKKMTTTNSMVVHKALANEEFAVSIFGPTFGRKGSIKKVQGRHNVVRLLVQASMIQLIGKYLGLPYWKLLDGAMADKVVIGRLTKRFYRMTEQEKILSSQEWLFLHGYDVNPTGKLDAQTKKALQKYNKFDPSKTSIDLDTFLRLYIDIPCNAKTLGRREKFARLHIEPSLTAHTAEPAQKYVKSQKKAAATPVKAEQRTAAAPPERAVTVTKRKTEQKNTVRGNAGIGRMLSDDEW